MKLIFKKNYKILVFIHFLLLSNPLNASTETFDGWLKSYKQFAFEKGVSKETINDVFKNVKFIEKVIEYDRRQPEFYEETNTYISKRATLSRAQIANKLYRKNKELFIKVEKEFNVEKEVLLALWGIETNFGKHVGKMDIISSLATLSYDKRRRAFFSNQLLTLLKLVDKQLIYPETLYGSWAGAFGNFQFMPSTISNYAIDYDKNNKIELKKSLNDSVASAANYINKIGWKSNEPCYYRVKLTKDIKSTYINTSAKNISKRLKISDWEKKGVIKYDGSKFVTDLQAALILPDNKKNSPSFLVFSNYEQILKWNRSLRFGVTVCKLAKMIKNDF